MGRTWRAVSGLRRTVARRFARRSTLRRARNTRIYAGWEYAGWERMSLSLNTGYMLKIGQS